MNVFGRGLRSVVVVCVIAATTAATADARTLRFSGERWHVKHSADRVGPGPNVFSKSRRNVRVDRRGRLHLRLTRTAQGWRSAEVIGRRALGYGTYRWVLDSPVNDLDRNAVLGLFTWSTRPAEYNREIDIEFSRWGQKKGVGNSHYTVQPYWMSGNQRSFRVGPTRRSYYGFTWEPDRITFFGSHGPTWVYSGPHVPSPWSARPRMNLWMFRGRNPERRGRRSVIFRKFTFRPFVTRESAVLHGARLGAHAGGAAAEARDAN